MRRCYECTDPSKKTAYTNTKDLAYPPKPRPTTDSMTGKRSTSVHLTSSNHSPAIAPRGGILLGILGGGVPPSSPNPDPISDQKV